MRDNMGVRVTITEIPWQVPPEEDWKRFCREQQWQAERDHQLEEIWKCMVILFLAVGMGLLCLVAALS